MWKGAKWGGEAIIVVAEAAGVSDIGDVLELPVAKFLQSLTCLGGLSLHLYLESPAEVAVVQTAGTTAYMPAFSRPFAIEANELSII